MIFVTVIATAQPGKGQELAEIWAKAGQRTLAEDAECKSFVVGISKENPDQLIASEVYTTQEALDAHNESDIAQEIIPTMMSLSAGPPMVHVADVVGG